MSLQNIPPNGENLNPATTYITPPQTRSQVLKYRLGYAAKNILTAPADVERKKPKLRGWQEKATTDPRTIHAESNKFPDAGVLMPTGKRSGRWSFDVDSLEDLLRLEEQLGVRLRGITRQVKTQSGNLQLHFLLPDDGGPEIRNSVGKSIRDGFEGLDVRGEGGLVLLPPSAGYEFANNLQSIEAPAELVEWARNRRRSQSCDSGPRKPRVEIPDGEPIPKGGRHNKLACIAGRLHDGTRDLMQLTEELRAINESRCNPPIGSPGDDDPLEDVERIARSIFAKEPCKPTRPPELDEMCERLGQLWYEVERRGLGGKSTVRLYRYLIREAAVIGTVVEGVGVGVTRSLREAEEDLGCHLNTVLNAKNRLVEAGLIHYDKSTCRDGGSATFVLLVGRARQNCDTSNNPLHIGGREVDDGVTKTSRLGAGELETLHYAHRGPVGYSREDTLCFVEAHPGHTREELAGLLGWARPRDLERMHLRHLEGLSLLEEHDGRWYVPEAYEKYQQNAHEIPYSTVQTRTVRRWSPEERRFVHYVAESGRVESQSVRQEEARERILRDRERFRQWRAERRRAVEHECFNGPAAPDDPAFDDLPSVGCYRPEGESWKLVRQRGYWSWVNFDTGELREVA